jgi:acetyl esterase/lipase
VIFTPVANTAQQPHHTPSIPRITLPEPLLGAVFISPWVGFDISKPSYQKNEFLDLIPPVAAQRWSAAYMGSAKPDYYNEPIRAPSSWWNDVPVKDVLITGGDEEILVDDIREFAAKFGVCTLLPFTRRVFPSLSPPYGG